MKTLRTYALPLILAAALSQQSCGTTEVAKAQQVVHASAVNFNAFIQFEKANRDQLWRLNPQIKKTADKLRHCRNPGPACETNATRWIESATAMVDAYKDNRTPEGRKDMDTAIAVIQELINQITEYFLDPQVRQIDPVTAVTYRRMTVVP